MLQSAASTQGATHQIHAASGGTTAADQQTATRYNSQSQAAFYRTTRSTQQQSIAVQHQACGECLQEETQQQLAIDHRNTLNLQKAIDQYYDGDLSID